ncbi:MAG: hypothetical protein NWF05_09965 [Candidatus Bathyarchaeota archaeon]|nr:hypothetical protein [Candidatus Bathyarchaeota archaeon]
MVFSVVALLVSALFVSAGFWALSQSQNPQASTADPADFYLGVTTGGNVSEAKAVIDKVKGYTNIVAFTSLEVTTNRTSLEEVADYAYSNGLSFLVQMVYPSPFASLNFDPFEWASDAKVKYGGQFLGYYLYDEPGGNQLEGAGFIQFDSSSMPYDYRDAANTYVYYLYLQMRDFVKCTPLFTSDYALYWYDYEAGYDTVLCQLGWNNSRPLEIALCRGAAEMHNKSWGAILTWTYQHPPYMESASELYADMVTAYNAGAKYVLIFNYPQTGPYGVLNEDHFNAIEDFWNYASQTPQNKTSNTQKTAYVVPDNYGWGFRNLNEKIWGVWEADELSPALLSGVTGFVQTYGDGSDIIYGSPWTQAFYRLHYDRLIWWNSTE